MVDKREGFLWDFEEVFRAHGDALKASIWTAMPASVVEDSDGKTVKLKLSVKGRTKDHKGKAQDVEYPVLQDVPIHFPGGGGDKGGEATVSTHPVKEKDEGVIVFMSRPLDNWFEKGGTQDAVDLRSHSLSDAVYIPGIRSKPRELKNISTDSHQVRSVDGKNTIDHHPASGTKIKSVDPSDSASNPFKDAKKFFLSIFHPSSGIAHQATDNGTTHEVKVTHTGGAAMSSNNGAHKVEAKPDKVSVTSSAPIPITAPSVNASQDITAGRDMSATRNMGVGGVLSAASALFGGVGGFGFSLSGISGLLNSGGGASSGVGAGAMQTGAAAANVGALAGDLSGNLPGPAVKIASYTVASLPAGSIGRMAVVTDGAAALAWGATVTGGGSAKYLCWHNGSNWTVFGK